jgi:hypothetical protein
VLQDVERDGAHHARTEGVRVQRKRRFKEIVAGVPLWCGPGPYVHAGFHHVAQARKIRNTVRELRVMCRSWAWGWEGDKFMVSFKSEVGGC